MPRGGRFAAGLALGRKERDALQAEIERLRQALSLAEVGEFAGQVGQGHLSTLVDELRAALQEIASLDPETHSPEGYNEWGQADCFTKAQTIAREALGELSQSPEQKADEDGWIAWGGGGCPVELETLVFYRLLNRAEYGPYPAEQCRWIWLYGGTDTDIIAYRVHKGE